MCETIPLFLIDEEKLSNKKAELGLSDEDEYDPFNNWLCKYLFFDNFEGDLNITSRHYDFLRNPGFVFEKKDEINLVLDKRSDQEKSEAKYDLGRYHYFEKRFVEAADCFTYSAEKGNDRAQDYLGRMYHDGVGLPQNSKKALFWLKKAASQDNPNSCYTLGEIHRSGKFVEEDNKKAVLFFKKAAKKI
jgi:TPR repeat protein